jgi:hypothetical protein
MQPNQNLEEKKEIRGMPLGRGRQHVFETAEG